MPSENHSAAAAAAPSLIPSPNPAVSLHQQDALRHLGYKTGEFPESEKAAATVLALPIYPELREDEQDRVVEAITSFYR